MRTLDGYRAPRLSSSGRGRYPIIAYDDTQCTTTVIRREAYILDGQVLLDRLPLLLTFAFGILGAHNYDCFRSQLTVESTGNSSTTDGESPGATKTARACAAHADSVSRQFSSVHSTTRPSLPHTSKASRPKYRTRPKSTRASART